MLIQKKQDLISGQYRRIEAMYRSGYNADEISNATGLAKMDVLDVMQNLFAKDKMRH